MAEDPTTGDVLVVYMADHGDARELRARRFTSGGVPIDTETDPVVIATDLGLGWNVDASVAGRSSGGWTVAWSDPNVDGEEAGIAARDVAPDGTLGTIRAMNVQTLGRQYEPEVFAVPGGYGVVWVDAGGVDGPLGSAIVKLTAFGDDGTLFITETAISDVTSVASEPAITMGDMGALFVWTEEAAVEADLSYVMGSMFGSAPGAPFVVSAAAGSEPALTFFGSGFGVAWVRRDATYDYLGDILVSFVDESTDPPTVPANYTIVDQQDHAEVAPSIEVFGMGALIAYEDGGHRQGVALAGAGGAPLTSEQTDLAGYLTDGLQGDVALRQTSKGIWVLWSDASDSSALGDPAAYRSVFGYLLPPD